VRIFNCPGSEVSGLAVAANSVDPSASSDANQPTWQIQSTLAEKKSPSIVPIFSTPAHWYRIGFGLQRLEPGTRYSLLAFFDTRGELDVPFYARDVKSLEKHEIWSDQSSFFGGTGDAHRMSLGEFKRQAKDRC
jgi:hypothetical protein